MEDLTAPTCLIDVYLGSGADQESYAVGSAHPEKNGQTTYHHDCELLVSGFRCYDFQVRVVGYPRHRLCHGHIVCCAI